MDEDLDKLVQDIEADKLVHRKEEELAREMLEVDEETASRLTENRKNKVSDFKLDLHLDEDNQAAGPADKAEKAEQPGEGSEPVNPEQAAGALKNEPDETDNQTENQAGKEPNDEEQDEENDAVNDGRKKAKKKSKGCLRGILYAVFVISVSVILAYALIAGGLDMTGLNKSDLKVPITVTEEQCKNTGEVAKILHEAGVIDHPVFFTLFCKLTGAGKNITAQEDATVSADMGYKAIINVLSTTVRKVVTVTFPEGSTLKDIAQKLENNNVCTVSDFYTALKSDSYTYDFLSEIPTDEEAAGRFDRLEGYIFPDTYDFYVNSSGEAVVNKFLANFDKRVDASMRAAIKAKGMTLNDVVIMASLIQWEAAKNSDMYGVSRVIHNRLEDSADFPHLQCDSTKKYVDIMQPKVNDVRVQNPYYDTYICNGLPVGAINNPGLVAIDAAINPSEDSTIMKCYYFATNTKTGITYFSKTYAEHVKICDKYDIGMYGNKNISENTRPY